MMTVAAHLDLDADEPKEESAKEEETANEVTKQES